MNYKSQNNALILVTNRDKGAGEHDACRRSDTDCHRSVLSFAHIMCPTVSKLIFEMSKKGLFLVIDKYKS